MREKKERETEEQVKEKSLSDNKRMISATTDTPKKGLSNGTETGDRELNTDLL